MARKMKILAAADLHGDSRLIRKLADRADKENVDLVVLCGDITGWTETKDLIKPFKEKNMKVLIIPGNWDSFATTDFLAEIYGIRNIHGYSVRYDSIGFFGAGGAEDSPGPGRVSEKQMMQTLSKAYAGLKGIERKIMVTHMHPSNSLSEMSGFEGSKAISNAIKKFKPDVVLHGHIHEAGGVEEKVGKTRVINVGREGRIIEI
jgi:putative phosphoesterase